MKYDFKKIEILYILEAISSNIEHEKADMLRLQFNSLNTILEKIISKHHSKDITDYAEQIKVELEW